MLWNWACNQEVARPNWLWGTAVVPLSNSWNLNCFWVAWAENVLNPKVVHGNGAEWKNKCNGTYGSNRVLQVHAQQWEYAQCNKSGLESIPVLSAPHVLQRPQCRRQVWEYAMGPCTSCSAITPLCLNPSINNPITYTMRTIYLAAYQWHGKLLWLSLVRPVRPPLNYYLTMRWTLLNGVLCQELIALGNSGGNIIVWQSLSVWEVLWWEITPDCVAPQSFW